MESVNLKKLLRRQAYKRIALELERFKERMLKQSPEKIYGAAYEIDSHVCIYEQLVEKIEECGFIRTHENDRAERDVSVISSM